MTYEELTDNANQVCKRYKNNTIVFIKPDKEEKKLFPYYYMDNMEDVKEYDYLTFGELVYTFGEDIAVAVWLTGGIPDEFI